MVILEMYMRTIIDLHRSSNTTKAIQDKALVATEKWKVVEKKDYEDVKFWRDQAEKYKTE